MLQVLSLTAQEWAELRVHPAAQRMFEQIRRYIDDASVGLAEGSALNSDPHILANSYTFTVGGIVALKEIVDYQPPREENDGEEHDE